MISDRKLLVKNIIENIVKNIRTSSKGSIKKNEKVYLTKNILIDYYNLVTKNIENKELTIYILHVISREINNSSSLIEKELLLSLLPEFYVPFLNENINLTDPYLSRILTSIQSNILSEISPIFIGEIYKKIIFYIFNDDYKPNKEPINKDLFDICQGFCLFNMKQNQYNYQLCGIICLNSLLNGIDYSFLNINNHIAYIWEKINFFLSSQSFAPKEYLLKYLCDFISKFNIGFKPYVNIAIYKILEFIDNKNLNTRKNSLDVLSILISFYPNEIKIIQSLILQLLIILQNDEDKDIKDKAIYIYNKIQNQSIPAIKFNNNDYTKKCSYCFFDLSNHIGYNNKNNDKCIQNNPSNRILNKRIINRKPLYNTYYDFLDNSIKRNKGVKEDIKIRKNSVNIINRRQIFNKSKFDNFNENKRYYGENTCTNVNKSICLTDNEGLGFRDLLTIVKKNSNKKCKINNNFSNLREEVKKNNKGLNQIRKIKSEKVMKTY